MSHQSMAILAYHKIGEPAPGGWKSWFYISEETFTEQMKVLHDHDWQVIDAFTFLKGLSQPDALPDRAALITYDDGYRSVRDVALPVLRRFGYPAVLFMPTDYIGDYNTFDDGIEPREAICDWDDLKELSRHGVSIQSHGATHRRFSELTLDEQSDELVRSKELLESHLGETVELIAFPYGDFGVHTEAATNHLKKTGYKAAFLYGGNPFALPVIDRYRLSRIAMGPDTKLEDLLK